MSKRQMTSSLLIACLVIGVTLALAGAAEEDQAALLDGVTEIALPCCIGPLVAFGDRAFPVVLGKAHDFREPVVAATRVGEGRAVAFGHPGYFREAALTEADGGRLIINAVSWAARSRPDRGAASPRVGVRECPDLLKHLQEHGIQAEPLVGDEWLEKVAALDVICCAPSGLSAPEREAVAQHIRDGGGLLAAEKGPDWLESNPGKALSQYPGNILLGEAGILWGEGHLGRPADERHFAGAAGSELCHADRAFEVVARHAEAAADYPPEEVGQAVHTLMSGLPVLAAYDTALMPRLKALLESHEADFSNMKEKPVAAADPLSRLLLGWQIEEMKHLPAGRVTPHPGADDFPGIVPADAPRASRALKIDTGVPGWHSTGLYAAPGEVIQVEVPPRVDGRDLSIRIGAHSDKLWHHAKWRRVPDITRSFPLTSLFTAAVNAFGGPIYIEVPEKCELGVISLTIRNAVEAPYYVRGKTDLREWRDTIRHRPAPWAELQGNNVILTIPSSDVRDLDDPERTMRFWDEVLDADADLAAMPRQRARPERMCADVQISAGYMHSGYPIMTHLDATASMVDPRRVIADRKGGAGWGFFHELGHNHQSGDWTFSGTGEVTVNLFTLYVCETVCGTPSRETREQLTPEWMLKQTKEHLSGGADFEKWKASPFLGLIMYAQLKDAFGWDAYKKVFAEYRSLPEEERPKSDDEKRDQWMIRFSRTVRKNLGPFFQTWGIPTSEEARESLSELPVWMPESFPPA